MDSNFQCDQFLVVCMFYSFSSNSINFLFFDYVINFSLPALLRAENQKTALFKAFTTDNALECSIELVTKLMMLNNAS